jgi:hypothetical protein
MTTWLREVYRDGFDANFAFDQPVPYVFAVYRPSEIVEWGYCVWIKVRPSRSMPCNLSPF